MKDFMSDIEQKFKTIREKYRNITAFEIVLNKSYDLIEKELQKIVVNEKKTKTLKIKTIMGITVSESSYMTKTTIRDGEEYELLGVVLKNKDFYSVIIGKKI